jgi:hypothetical protein
VGLGGCASVLVCGWVRVRVLFIGMLFICSFIYFHRVCATHVSVAHAVAT